MYVFVILSSLRIRFLIILSHLRYVFVILSPLRVWFVCFCHHLALRVWACYLIICVQHFFTECPPPLPPLLNGPLHGGVHYFLVTYFAMFFPFLHRDIGIEYMEHIYSNFMPFNFCVARSLYSILQ